MKSGKAARLIGVYKRRASNEWLQRSGVGQHQLAKTKFLQDLTSLQIISANATGFVMRRQQEPVNLSV
jgi:hypothetical protein